MQAQKKDSNTKFHKLLNKVKDFDLDIETVYYDNVPKMDEVCDKLQTYDMLVIGFGDCYDIDNTNGHLDQIKHISSQENRYCLLMIQRHFVIIK